MAEYDRDTLRHIYGRTDGRCHICGDGLCYSNYGTLGARGAWEVEHSVPRAAGGTDRLNNLYAAHIVCNREKGTCATRTARFWHGLSRAPESTAAVTARRDRYTVAGALTLAGLGLFLGPFAAVVGLVAGGALGRAVATSDRR
ncbi:HNH endonuclease [candidate division WOR-3 bacterium]|nr:HNH endonuclease [candidate division WOR-3 bacterium]